MTAASHLLAPLGAVYGLAGRLRRESYRRGWQRQESLRGPVISVGNLTVGGSGKTPVVAALAAELHAAGRRVAILSRGYRGSNVSPALLVSDGNAVLVEADVAGDEPTLLARELPGVIVAVGRRRVVVGRQVEARFGPCVHLLDDGFQHLNLARDLDLVCLSAADLDDRPLPAGRLREPAAAVCHADAVLVTGDEADVDNVRRRLGHEHVFRAVRRVHGLFTPGGVAAAPAPARPFLFCGIARPERFRADVCAHVGAPVGEALFRDHHSYSARDLERLVERARRTGADVLLTTAKDAVRLPAVGLAIPLAVLKISVTVEPEGLFRRLVLDAIERRSEGSAG